MGFINSVAFAGGLAECVEDYVVEFAADNHIRYNQARQPISLATRLI